MKKVFGVLFTLVIALSSCTDNSSIDFAASVPLAGNAWLNGDEVPAKRNRFSKEGVLNWAEQDKTVRIYFRTEHTGKIYLGLRAKAQDGPSKIKLSFKGKQQGIAISDTSWQDIEVGVFKIEKPGYHTVELIGFEKTGESYGQFKDLLIGGEATLDSVYYVKDSFYWGRRGPSVHLNYQVPEEAGDIEYFYNEITVPEGEDVLGSYFMANGFAQGYFGIQVNSSEERRILFSVWSPYKTDNPKEIPEDQR
ncbi:DUF5077 domain-containing protein, partial [Carboxylicivirga sp. M1479]